MITYLYRGPALFDDQRIELLELFADGTARVRPILAGGIKGPEYTVPYRVLTRGKMKLKQGDAGICSS